MVRIVHAPLDAPLELLLIEGEFVEEHMWIYVLWPAYEHADGDCQGFGSEATQIILDEFRTGTCCQKQIFSSAKEDLEKTSTSFADS